MVYIIDVTLRACHGLVCTRQREARIVVTESRWSPHRGCVARTAIVTEIASHMIRVGRPRKLHLMTLVAIVEHKLVVTVHVARLTLDRCVSAGQREVRRAVVERCRAPCTRRVAHRALMREVERLMVRIRRTIEVRSVAIVARRW